MQGEDTINADDSANTHTQRTQATGANHACLSGPTGHNDYDRGVDFVSHCESGCLPASLASLEPTAVYRQQFL